jgi:two-component system chemotaxis response regulator CheY
MTNLDNELAEAYLDECRDHLATMETTLLAIEKGGNEIDEEQVKLAFRAVHSVKGGAVYLDLVQIGELAHQTEGVLALICSHKMAPTRDRVGVLLHATDRLHDLIENPSTSNQADIADVMAALATLGADQPAPAGKLRASAVDRVQRGGRQLRMLVAEDDFVCRLILQTFLSPYGECHVAVNGREAVETFRSALERGEKYDLICMDIMMPEMDGREAVLQVRALEEAHGVLLNYGAKIIMTTALDDIKGVFQCFKALCDAYLVKPIDLAKLLSQMKSY